ncbi:MAG: hypothetical protein IPN08_05615 [Bacteroidales bacterium]|nr:hypothetical protein [Bacteroidales bacterium]
MKIRLFLGILLLPVLSLSSGAQTPLQKYLGVEAGIIFISAKMPEIDFIRGDIPAYPGGYSSTYLKSYMNKGYTGIKGEVLSRNNKFGFSAGLRYIQMNSSVGRNTYWTGNTNYFYLMYRQDGVNTEYLKVKELDQRTSYLGIPLEARFSPIMLVYSACVSNWALMSGLNCIQRLTSFFTINPWTTLRMKWQI